MAPVQPSEPEDVQQDLPVLGGGQALAVVPPVRLPQAGLQDGPTTGEGKQVL